MGFKDLKILAQKEKRAYLILTIWLLIGYTFLQFDPNNLIGVNLLFFLLSTCLLYFIFNLIIKNKIDKHPLLFLLLCLFLAFPLNYIIINYGLVVIVILFVIAIYFWLIATAIFVMDNCYEKSIDWDNKIKNWKKPYNTILRISLFVGGAILATELLILVSIIALNVNNPSDWYQLVINYLYLNMWFTIWVLFIVGLILVIFKKFNFWLGIFFLFITFYAINIIIIVVQVEFGPGSLTLPFLTIQYVFNIFILLSSTVKLLGKRAEQLRKKLKFIDTDILLIGLIYSMAAFQFGKSILGNVIIRFSINLTALIFPYLALLFGIYAIVRHSKKSKKEEEVKREPLDVLRESDVKDVDRIQEQREMVPDTRDTVYCTQCGALISTENKFCVECGAKIE